MESQSGAPGRAGHLPYLRDLDAGETIDRTTDVTAAIRERHPDGINALLDLVNRDPATFAANTAVLTAGGRAASALGAAGGDLPSRVSTKNVMNASEPARFEQLARLIDSGKLTGPDPTHIPTRTDRRRAQRPPKPPHPGQTRNRDHLTVLGQERRDEQKVTSANSGESWGESWCLARQLRGE